MEFKISSVCVVWRSSWGFFPFLFLPFPWETLTKIGVWYFTRDDVCISLYPTKELELATIKLYFRSSSTIFQLFCFLFVAKPLNRFRKIISNTQNYRIPKHSQTPTVSCVPNNLHSKRLVFVSVHSLSLLSCFHLIWICKIYITYFYQSRFQVILSFFHFFFS